MRNANRFLAAISRDRLLGSCSAKRRAACSAIFLAGATSFLCSLPCSRSQPPGSVTAIGLGFYALHNTLQTNATQMTPQARGTAVAIFSSAIYLGQTIGVAAGAVVFDRFTAVPLFAGTAVALPALAFWFAAKLRWHGTQGGAEANVQRP